MRPSARNWRNLSRLARCASSAALAAAASSAVLAFCADCAAWRAMSLSIWAITMSSRSCCCTRVDSRVKTEA